MPGISSISITWDDQDRPEITVNYGGDREQSGGGLQADPEAWLAALADRLNDEGANFLAEMIEANATDGAISLADLATRVGVDTKKVEVWNRVLGKHVKAVGREHGWLRKDNEDGTAQLFDWVWDQDGNRWLYTVPEKFRATLLGYLRPE